MEPSCGLLQLTLVIIILVTNIKTGDGTRFIIKNNCPYTIWPAAVPNGISPALGTSGLTLLQGFSATIDAPSSWSGRLWARTLCSTDSSGNLTCFVGDCGSGTISCSGPPSKTLPPTLLEFSLNSFGNNDFYDISVVDGFNLPATITPEKSACKSAGCPKDINSVCPWAMAIKDPSNEGQVVACKNACSVSGTEDDCSQSDYAAVFKSQCPEAYSYSTDDATATFYCPTGGDYYISFCSASTQPQYIGMVCVP